MIIVITVVMLLTLHPARDLHAGGAATSVGAPRPGPRVGVGRGRGRRRRLSQPPEPEQQLLDLQRDATCRPTATRRSRPGSRCRARTTTARRSGTRRTRRRPASTGTIYLTSSGKSRSVHPDGEGRHPAPGLPRLPVPDRLRDRRSRRCRATRRRASSTRGSRTPARRPATGPTRRTAASCTGPTPRR